MLKNRKPTDMAANASAQRKNDPTTPDWRKIYECPPSSVGRCYFVLGPGSDKLPSSLSPILKPVVAAIFTELEKEQPNHDVIEVLMESFDPKVLKAVKRALSVGKDFQAILRLTLYDPRFGMISTELLQTFCAVIHPGPGRRGKPLRKFVDAYFARHQITLEKVAKDRQRLLKEIYTEAKATLRLAPADSSKDRRFIREVVLNAFPAPNSRKLPTPKLRQGFRKKKT